MRALSVLAILLTGWAVALPSSDYVLHESRDAIGDGWFQDRAASLDTVIPMRIALKQRNLDQIPSLLHDVADPDSPNFGKHWTADQLAHKFAPAEGTVRAVKSWLSSAGIPHRLSPNKGWVEVQMTVAQAEKLLMTKYHVYKRDGEEHEQVDCHEYNLPGYISAHVDFIMSTAATSELKRSSRKRAAKSTHGKRLNFVPVGGAEVSKLVSVLTPQNTTSDTTPLSCSQGVTPACIKAMYGIPKGTSSVDGNELGVYETENYYDQADLDLFFTKFSSDITNGTAPVLNSIDGGLGPQQNGVEGESVLDLEVAFPLVHPQGIRLLQVDDPAYSQSPKRGHFDSLLDALDESFCTFMGGDNSTFDATYPLNTTGGYNGTKMCGAFTPPTVISISYGYLESMFSPAYLTRQCLEFGKLGLAGTTVVASSGDSGVSASYCANPKMLRASPQFPASCPYVTTVGATMLVPNATDLTGPDSEVGANDNLAYQSGGGFSDVFGTPSYQTEAVAAYLEAFNSAANRSGMQPDINYNASGRAYPDVSAIGRNVTTVTNGRVFNADGTSASAPLFASLITLVNEIRMGGGKGPIGFINPTLYRSGASAFKDIKSGNNGGCGIGGFDAMEGWDPVTGWGSPHWEPLKDLLVSV